MTKKLDNGLPPASQQWVRALEKKVADLTKALSSITEVGRSASDTTAQLAKTRGEMISVSNVETNVLEVLSSDHEDGTPAVRISGEGVRLFGDSGAETVSLTGKGGQYITLKDSAGEDVSSLDNAGGASFSNLSVTDTTRVSGPLNMNGDPINIDHGTGLNGPTINGRDLLGPDFTDRLVQKSNLADDTGWMNALPLGQVVNAWRDEGTTALTIPSDGAIMRLQATYDFEVGRVYSIAFTAPSFRVDTPKSPPNTGVYCSLSYSPSGGPLGAGGGNFIRGLNVRQPATGFYYKNAASATVRCPENIPAGRVTIGISASTLTGVTATNQAIPGDNYWQISVFDMGLHSTENQGVAVNLTKSSTPPEPPAGQGTRYTKTWSATWGKTYRTNLTPIVDLFENTVDQGYSATFASNGVRKSLISFPDVTPTLSGARIDKVEVYLYSSNWLNSAGGVAGIGVHGHMEPPLLWSAYPINIVNQPMKRPEGRWVTLPSGLHAGFKAGSYRGISLSAPEDSTSTAYSGSMTTDKTKLRITYSK